MIYYRTKLAYVKSYKLLIGLMCIQKLLSFCLLHHIFLRDVILPSIILKNTYFCNQFKITEISVSWFGSFVSWLSSCSTWFSYVILLVYNEELLSKLTNIVPFETQKDIKTHKQCSNML